MFHKSHYQLQTQRCGVSEIDFGRESHAVVADLQPAQVIRGGLESDTNLAPPVIRKGIFQGIGHQLVDDQTARNRLVNVQSNVVHGDIHGH
ncbi:MAG: hypothetical protein L6437_15970 [Kiritimatiellae bacterium]|nr:hypothetical protein [Kiritimatiellia bacterium]